MAGIDTAVGASDNCHHSDGAVEVAKIAETVIACWHDAFGNRRCWRPRWRSSFASLRCPNSTRPSPRTVICQCSGQRGRHSGARGLPLLISLHSTDAADPWASRPRGSGSAPSYWCGRVRCGTRRIGCEVRPGGRRCSSALRSILARPAAARQRRRLSLANV
jgi:hypothetical protein